MKTQENKTRFNKKTIVELNNSEMTSINGGTSDALPISSCICPYILKTLTIDRNEY